MAQSKASFRLRSTVLLFPPVTLLLLAVVSCASEIPGPSETTKPPICVPDTAQACYTGPEGTEGKGICTAGLTTCNADGSAYGPCEAEVVPGFERCETPEDEDCDGLVNEEDAGCICDIGEQQSCYTGPPNTEGQGLCKGGTAACFQGTSWGTCEGEITPNTEDCKNTEDEDCDGIACSAPIWSAIFGSNGDDRSLYVVVDADGNSYITGKFAGTVNFGGMPLVSSGGDDIFFAKFDAQGVHQWSQKFGDTADQYATGIAIGADGNIVVVGFYKGTLTFNQTLQDSHAPTWDSFVAAFNPADGQPLWGKSIGYTGNDVATGVAVAPSGDIIVVGNFDAQHYCTGVFPLITCKNSAGGKDIFIRKYTSTGDIVEADIHTYGSTGDQSPAAVAVDSNANIIITGDFTETLDFGNGTIPIAASAANSKVFVTKFDPTINAIWAQKYGADNFNHRGTSIAINALNQAVISGNFDGNITFGAITLNGSGSDDAFVAMLDEGGQALWSKKFGHFTNQSAQRVALDTNGNVLVTGGFEGVVDFGGGNVISGGSFDHFVVKLAPDGSHLWSKGFGDTANQVGFGVAADPVTLQVVTTGYAVGTVDFGLGPLTSMGGEDITIARFQP